MAKRDMTGILLIAAAGAAAWALSKRASAATAAAGGAGSAPGSAADNTSSPPDVTAAYDNAGVLAPSAPVIELSGSFWDSLAPSNPLPSGYVDFPSGSQAAAALLTTRVDALGNAYVQWAGQTYELGAQDDAGNYPATLVTQ